MKINGKERGFFYGVLASGKLATLCKDKSVSNIWDLLENDEISARYAPKIANILNEADEMRKVYEAKARGEEYTADILTEEEIYTLPMYEIQDILVACVEAIQRGSVREIETKAPKKKESAAKKSS